MLTEAEEEEGEDEESVGAVAGIAINVVEEVAQNGSSSVIVVAGQQVAYTRIRRKKIHGSQEMQIRKKEAKRR